LFVHAVRDLLEALRLRVEEKDFGAVVGVGPGEVAVGGEGDEPAVVGDRGLKRALGRAARGVVGLRVRDLAQARAVVEEDFGVAVAVLAQGVVLACEGGARAVLRERGRGAARVRQLLEVRAGGSL
jgi:hypothetical protein